MEFLIRSIINGKVYINGENILHAMCRHGNLFFLSILAQSINKNYRYLLNEYNREGRKCIHIAAVLHKGQVATDIITILVNFGADINGRVLCTGDTVLHIAVYLKDYYLAKWLCRRGGINRNARNYAGLTPFLIASKNNAKQMMTVL
uniref:Uncharacterized protein n=1 Tax=Microplitis mediator bracovirus TaxID=1836595 RepID=A0A1D5API3_9VIRU|nr:hypothetical protein A6F54_56 [Microplitis mediator bracovirus]